jgi:hypothetical protein
VIGRVAVTQAFLPCCRLGADRQHQPTAAATSPYLSPPLVGGCKPEGVTTNPRFGCLGSTWPSSWRIVIQVRNPADSASVTAKPEFARSWHFTRRIGRRFAGRWRRRQQRPHPPRVADTPPASFGRRPKTYYIASASEVLLQGIKLLPDGIRDWLVEKAMGLR